MLMQGDCITHDTSAPMLLVPSFGDDGAWWVITIGEAAYIFACMGNGSSMASAESRADDDGLVERQYGPHDFLTDGCDGIRRWR